MEEVIGNDREDSEDDKYKTLEELLLPKYGNTELRTLMIEGCREDNKATARYYLFEIAEGLGMGADNIGDVTIRFMTDGEQVDKSDWDDYCIANGVVDNAIE